MLILKYWVILCALLVLTPMVISQDIGEVSLIAPEKVGRTKKMDDPLGLLGSCWSGTRQTYDSTDPNRLFEDVSIKICFTEFQPRNEREKYWSGYIGPYEMSGKYNKYIAPKEFEPQPISKTGNGSLALLEDKDLVLWLDGGTMINLVDSQMVQVPESNHRILLTRDGNR